jgi:hypothetical protein
MTTQVLDFASADLRRKLDLLERERASAVLEGLAGNALYMEDLLEERHAVRSAYVGAAVTEIASLRAALGAPLLG